MVVNMKVFGIEIFVTVKDLKDTPMEIHILDNSEMVKPTEKVYIHGKMGKSMMENGTKD